jgi:hypothetical protein
MRVTDVRALWWCLEAVHGMIYFAPEADERYAEVGLDRTGGYFASRSAAMGAVFAEVVIATFYNFRPGLVRAVLPAAWEKVEPAALLGIRLAAVDHALRRGLGPVVDSPEVAEAAALARVAAEGACEVPHGRPLFAAHAALPWPDEPHLVLWHAQTLLREFRGDGHVTALLAEGVTPLEALVLHAASGAVPAESLRRTRDWSEEDWAATVEDLRSRGLLDAEAGFTAAGAAFRQRVEDRTDALAVGAYRTLGEVERARLVQLGGPLSRRLVEAGMIGRRK